MLANGIRIDKKVKQNLGIRGVVPGRWKGDQTELEGKIEGMTKRKFRKRCLQENE